MGRLIEEFHVPFGGTLDPENRWVLFFSLAPWEELEEPFALSSTPGLVRLRSQYGFHLVRCSSAAAWPNLRANSRADP